MLTACNICTMVLAILLIAILSYLGYIVYRLDRRHWEFDERARRILNLLAPCIHRIPPDTLIRSLKSQGVDLSPDMESRLKAIRTEAFDIEDRGLLEEKEATCDCRKNKEDGS